MRFPWRRKKPAPEPRWLKEVKYWLTASSRKRHDEPFNKREAGKERREERRFAREGKGRFIIEENY